MTFGIFLESGFGEKGIEIEREDSELGLWKNLTMVGERKRGHQVCLWKKFCLLIIIIFLI